MLADPGCKGDYLNHHDAEPTIQPSALDANQQSGLFVRVIIKGLILETASKSSRFAIASMTKLSHSS
jgi:hypothetical protein